MIRITQRAYGTHFLACNTPHTPNPTQGVYSAYARKRYLWRVNSTRSEIHGIDTHFHDIVLENPSDLSLYGTEVIVNFSADVCPVSLPSAGCNEPLCQIKQR